MSLESPFLRIATRNSALALWQTREAARIISETHPHLDVRLEEVRTVGDKVQDRALSALGSTGVFTREVDAAVLDGRAECAMHSLKDQTTVLPDGLVIGMVLPRGPVEDAFIGREGRRLAELTAGARVATGSLRRKAQLLRQRPDLEVVDIRGNVDGRLAKLDAGSGRWVDPGARWARTPRPW